MTSFQRGYAAMLEKLAVSKELAQKVLMGKGIGLVMDDLLAAQRSGKSMEHLLAPLKKFPRTIRKAGPEARRQIYGPPQVEPPVRWADMAWEAAPATKGRIETLYRLGLLR